AGVAAAGQGSSTIVLEMQHGMGGVGTLGLISSYYFGNIVGYTSLINKRVDEAMGRAGKDPAPRTWNPNVKDLCHQQALLDAGGSAWLGSFAVGVTCGHGRVTGVLVSTPFGSGLVRAGAGVDSTGSADTAAAAGAPWRLIDE